MQRLRFTCPDREKRCYCVKRNVPRAYPTCAPATKNRAAARTMAAILHRSKDMAKYNGDNRLL